MMEQEPKFIFDTGQCQEGWEHFPYHFFPLTAFSKHDEQIMYDWCLENLISIGGWNINWYSVVILHDDDAVLFKMRWC